MAEFLGYVTYVEYKPFNAEKYNFLITPPCSNYRWYWVDSPPGICWYSINKSEREGGKAGRQEVRLRKIEVIVYFLEGYSVNCSLILLMCIIYISEIQCGVCIYPQSLVISSHISTRACAHAQMCTHALLPSCSLSFCVCLISVSTMSSIYSS